MFTHNKKIINQGLGIASKVDWLTGQAF